MEASLKRSRPATPLASAKRTKVSARFDTSGRSLYYLASHSALSLHLPAIPLRALLSLALDDEQCAESALIITERVEEKLATEVQNQCAGKVLILTNEAPAGEPCTLHLPTKAIRANLWIVRFADRLRVAITTGSLHSWDVKRRLHTLWFQDFALGYRPCSFSFDLCKFVYELVPASVLADSLDINLGRYDFSPVAVDLITTVPGSFPQHTPFGLLQLQRSVPPSTPYSAVLISTTDLPPPNLLLSLQAQLNLPKYTTLHIGYPSLGTVQRSRFGAVSTPTEHSLRTGVDLFYDIEVKKGLGSIGRTVLPGYNFIVIGGEMVPEEQMVIYCGTHAFSSEHWGEEASGQWHYRFFSLGVAFKPGTLQAEEAKAVLRSIPYAVGERLGEMNEPWEPRHHLIYL